MEAFLLMQSWRNTHLVDWYLMLGCVLSPQLTMFFILALAALFHYVFVLIDRMSVILHRVSYRLLQLIDLCVLTPDVSRDKNQTAKQ